MPYDPRSLLVELARRGALEHQLDISTGSISSFIGCSQQTASLYMIKLATDGYIERTMKRYGSKVRITEKGLDLLYGTYLSLFDFFGRSRSIDLVCKVGSGLGEGAYYLAQQGYIDQVKVKLGFHPFPGTLNLELMPQDSPVIDLLRKGPGIEIVSFASDGRTFGRCLCYECRIRDRSGAVMVPFRTIHKRTLEIISDVRLRDIMDLKDGESVKIQIIYPGEEPGGASSFSGPS
jgi:riboflavin kinase